MDIELAPRTLGVRLVELFRVFSEKWADNRREGVAGEHSRPRSPETRQGEPPCRLWASFKADYPWTEKECFEKRHRSSKTWPSAGIQLETVSSFPQGHRQAAVACARSDLETRLDSNFNGLAELTESFLDNRLEDPVLENLSADFGTRLRVVWPTFLTALSNLALLRTVSLDIHRRRAAEGLLQTFLVPLLRDARRRIPRNANVSWSLDAVRSRHRRSK